MKQLFGTATLIINHVLFAVGTAAAVIIPWWTIHGATAVSLLPTTWQDFVAKYGPGVLMTLAWVRAHKNLAIDQAGYPLPPVK